MIDFRVTRIRSNPRFRLLPFDKVEEFERRPLESLAAAPDFYGFLAPPPTSALPVKSVSRDAALLFLTLREPACMPHLLESLFGEDVQNQMRELILDGIFEVERGEGFVSGTEVFPDIEAGEVDVAHSRVAQLSADAITYAAALEGLEVGDLAMRLYMYNRSPSTPQLQRDFASDEQIMKFLIDGGSTVKQLDSNWMREVNRQSWIVWKHDGPVLRHEFKLYVSPSMESLPQAFQIAVDTFVHVRCSYFKLGRTAFGLVRPDKLVAYFATLEELQEAAELIRASAAGMTAQGVPFTAAIDADGLVSWGMDPPRFDQVLSGQEHQSWRQWLAGRLAIYTLAAKAKDQQDISKLVLHRVKFDGIDPITWSPNLTIWRGRAANEEETA